MLVTPDRFYNNMLITSNLQLLAWAVGDFEYVAAPTQRKYNGINLPVRVYTTWGLKEQAHYALECASRTVDYFSELFKIDYPLPKTDLLAVHEFVGSTFLIRLSCSLTIGHSQQTPWKIGASLCIAPLRSSSTKAVLTRDTRTILPMS
jgi:hypothetical protein